MIEGVMEASRAIAEASHVLAQLIEQLAQERDEARQVVAFKEKTEMGLCEPLDKSESELWRLTNLLETANRERDEARLVARLLFREWVPSVDGTPRVPVSNAWPWIHEEE
jgi:hypothetical protein